MDRFLLAQPPQENQFEKFQNEEQFVDQEDYFQQIDQEWEDEELKESYLEVYRNTLRKINQNQSEGNLGIIQEKEDGEEENSQQEIENFENKKQIYQEFDNNKENEKYLKMERLSNDSGYSDLQESVRENQQVDIEQNEYNFENDYEKDFGQKRDEFSITKENLKKKVEEEEQRKKEKRKEMLDQMEKQFQNKMNSTGDQFYSQKMYENFENELKEFQIQAQTIKLNVQEMLKQKKDQKNFSNSYTQNKMKIPKKDLETVSKELEIQRELCFEYQAIIRILKVELRKQKKIRDNKQNGQKNNAQNALNNSVSSQKSKQSIFLVTKEDLQEENLQLKQQISELKEQMSKEKSKFYKLNMEMQKQFVAEMKKIKAKINNNVKDPILIEKLNEQDKIITKLRQKVTEQIEKISQNNENLKEKDQEINKLRINKKESTVSNFEKKISKLQEEIDSKNQIIQQLKEDYALDNQLKLLYPNKIQIVQKLLTVLLKIEETDQLNEQDLNKLLKIFRPLCDHIDENLNSSKDFFQQIFQKKKSGPTQENIQTDPIKILAENKFILENKELIKELKLTQNYIELLQQEIGDLQKQIIEDKDYLEGLEKRNKELEQNMLDNRLDLARSLSLIMMRIMKNDPDYDYTEHISYKKLKEYVDFLEKPSMIKKQIYNEQNYQKQQQDDLNQILNEDQKQEQKNLQNQKNVIHGYLKNTKTREIYLQQQLNMVEELNKMRAKREIDFKI